ncbi:multidrug efflux SMR transporter [Escherichia coli]|jgi:small multidrug resistance pump|uniref:Guanidinium exporter n=2 Tax=Gammaproteobacteria TaxID=1236 RepID=A0A2P1BQC5_9GAMM|nr:MULTISPECIES: multidrug efflux SMR transporter [Gammaproteobacteria]ECU8224751.1 QacE family quaternary ammonium compound efflux SMR transporter [Salmonella enterica subsp. enterica serovar Thompson]EKO3677201.1 multidrug efflux SMR transporter [Vibrio metschnikovii]EKU5386361.1 multidrug efflux SMR transporter [Escherichia coli]ELA9961553.1 multidrug efflux SMR transporter [Proteus mirabilis]HCR4036254.1 multidrug efflux SMR transporter [Morganella morganii]HEC8328900.1 multidrug efflux S
MAWFYLLMGVLTEAVSHVALKVTDGFTRPVPAAIVVLGHIAAFLFLSQAMRDLPVGIVHAVWAGSAIILVSLLSMVIYKQHLDITVWIGISFIAFGVMVINLSAAHSH